MRNFIRLGLVRRLIFIFLSDHSYIIFNMIFELSREPFRTIILYDWKIGLTYKGSHAPFDTGMGDQAASDRTVFNWFHELQRGNYSTEDATRSGRPRATVNEEIIDAVRTLIENDSHSTVQQIKDILGIGSSAVDSIIHDYLKLRKVCVQWAPHQLTDDQKQSRNQFCQHSFKRFEEDRSRRVFDVITRDEEWFYHYDPETKEQTKMWVSKTDPRPIKVLQNKSSGK